MGDNILVQPASQILYTPNVVPAPDLPLKSSGAPKQYKVATNLDQLLA